MQQEANISSCQDCLIETKILLIFIVTGRKFAFDNLSVPKKCHAIEGKAIDENCEN